MKYAGTIGYTTPFMYDENGIKHTFITLTSVGVTSEGQALPLGHHNKEDAWAAFDEQLERFRVDSKWGDFHWRKFPTLHPTPGGKYYVISQVICTKRRLYESLDMLPIPREGSKTPITDRTIEDYIDLPSSHIGGSICDVRYEMEQLELDAQRYRKFVEIQHKMAKLLQIAGETLDKNTLDQMLDMARVAPTFPLENVMHTIQYLERTKEDFAARVQKAQESLPENLPTVLCGKVD